MKNIKHIFGTVKSSHPFLYGCTMFTFVVAAISLMGLFIDERTLLGVNVWVKPLKFAISIAIFYITIGFFLNFYPYSNRKKKLLAGATAWANLIEILIIAAQAGRGVQSHYNMSSPLDSLMYLGMGIMVTVNVLIMVIFLIDTIRLKMDTERSIQWAIFLGWVIILLGSWVGGQMISQMAHNVGVADGGEGLPILNWSTKGGDLRIAHFFGLHGLQIIPLFALWVSNKWKTSNKNQIIAVSGFALLYAGWIAYIFFQAKQGMPLIALN